MKVLVLEKEINMNETMHNSFSFAQSNRMVRKPNKTAPVISFVAADNAVGISMAIHSRGFPKIKNLPQIILYIDSRIQ